MNAPHQVHIQIGAHAPEAITVRSDETIASLLARFRDEHPRAAHEIEHLVVFAEDSEEEVAHDRKVSECHPHWPKILHCHRCRKVSVSVYYNGEESRAFGPNATVRKVTKWATKQFGVDEGRKWVLRLDSAEGEILDPDTRLGKLVDHASCALSLYLTERCLIQG
jgi:hypothetical protein